MTEDEAKTKWCPHVRGLSVEVNGAYTGTKGVGMGNSNESKRNPEWSRCIGSACMAWRWQGTHINDPKDPQNLVWSNDTHGFCGLAGKP